VRGGRRAREGARKKEREREKRDQNNKKSKSNTRRREFAYVLMRVKVSSLPLGVRVMVRFAYVPEPLGGPMHHIINHKTRVVPLKWR
jgi:hypothetical protein